MVNLAQMEREAAAALPKGSVLAVLYEQHARIRELFAQVRSADGAAKQTAFDQLRELLAVHEAGEEMVVRPASKMITGEEIAKARNREESEAAHALADLEKQDVHSAEFARGIAKLELDVSDHARREETEEFPRIQTEFSPLEQQRLGERLLRAEKAAPTHPHPAAAGSTAAQYTVGPFAAMLDKAKDAFAKKDG